MFRFKMRAVEKDPEGYYYVRWDRATPLIVIAETREDAYKKCWALMGKSSRGWAWTAVIDAIEEVPEVAESKLEAVRKYAEDRSHYGRQGRTVHSSRIASDLFQILAVGREGESHE